MTEYGTNIETILTTSTDNFADRVLLFGQVTEKKEKAHPSHFLKFLLASRTNGTLAFAPDPTSHPFGKSQRAVFFSTLFFGSSKLITIFVNLFR
ncbi:hypothetical protein A3SI_18352 [Nitritalea halalkaliphila LW7]|uniref:Uncharacterized protein n=1 Tax=Nitritalea halalkaliphila LW7 TaxID=1189621 RepID=I5BUD6_9BACT|nr:hypothetical protein [Nitritalea halalkaliphila]EIM73188.1 hypothetical protein A3SI_18352 [Nitritalea halalkaliphila LW7]